MRLQNNKEKIGHYFRPGSKKLGYLTVLSVVIHNCKTKITKDSPYCDTSQKVACKRQTQISLYFCPDEDSQLWIPVCDVAVADALHVSEAGAPQQPVLAGVQRQQQVAHPVGVVDGLAEHRALLLLHALRLHFLAERRPQPVLLRCQVQGADFPPAG